VNNRVAKIRSESACALRPEILDGAEDFVALVDEEPQLATGDLYELGARYVLCDEAAMVEAGHRIVPAVQDQRRRSDGAEDAPDLHVEMIAVPSRGPSWRRGRPLDL